MKGKKNDIVVKKSKISNKGVFANRNFKKGEVVLSWNPKALKESEVEKIPTDKRHYIYKSVDNGYFLMQSPEKYVNHSCDANTEARNGRDVAIKDIKKGEEITSDYTRQGSSTSFICTCGTEKCRGFIKRFDLKI
ncbi:MAG: SET domain-containing protein [Candidatus Pacebacteria bacterium]|nr:SET domain-containing protein [Candidatus Paceibacterota bacterium]